MYRVRWYADEVERVTFSDRVVDNPKYRLQQLIMDEWEDVPCYVAKHAKITEVDLRMKINAEKVDEQG